MDVVKCELELVMKKIDIWRYLEMEDEFKSWLKKEGLQLSTQSNYAIHLREHIPKHLNTIGISQENIFNMESIEEIEEILKLFKKDGKLYSLNKDQGNFPSASLNKYIDFLKMKNINISVDDNALKNPDNFLTEFISTSLAA